MEPWNTRINRKFSSIVEGAQEKEYYTPYNALLHEVFRLEEGYFVCPQVYPLRDRKSTDFGVEYEVGFEKQDKQGIPIETPVMLLEIKKSTHYWKNSLRQKADEQVRERLTAMRSSLRIPILIVISALGTRCCVYRYKWTEGTVTPAMKIPESYKHTEDLAPSEWWNIDISTLEGRLKLNNVFGEIKAMSVEL